MSDNVPLTKRGTLPQRIWWTIRDLHRQLKPCRFSFLVVLIAWPVFLYVPQGTETLRAVGEGMTVGANWDWLRVILFFGALILWAICSWYAARVLLYFSFPGMEQLKPRSELADVLVPRLLGVAPIAIIAFGFVLAARSYAPTEPARRWLVGFGVLSTVIGVIFYLFVVVRRIFIGAMTVRRVKHIHEL